MPASEKTWRDQKALHVVFGCTGLLLLIATLWMFGADHTRQWKQYQRQMRNIDVRLTQWRMEASQTQENALRRKELASALTDTRSAPPPQQAFEQFVRVVPDEETANRLRELYARLSDPGTSDAELARISRRLDDQMSELISLARFEEENLLSRRKFKSADYDEKRATFDLGIRDGKPQEELDELQRAVDEEKRQRDELTLAYQAAADYRKQLDTAHKQMQAPAEQIKKELADLEAEYTRLASTRRATCDLLHESSAVLGQAMAGIANLGCIQLAAKNRKSMD